MATRKTHKAKQSKNPVADDSMQIDMDGLTAEEMSPESVDGEMPLEELERRENPFEPLMEDEDADAEDQFADQAWQNLPTTGEGIGGARTLEIVDVPLEQIRPNPKNPNEQTPEVFNQLVATLNDKGVDQPMVVRRLKEPDGDVLFEIIKGEHRWRAARVLGWETFPTVIREDWDELTAITELVKDNVVKGELNKEKFTDVVRMLQRDFNLDHDLIAAMTGFDGTKELYANMVIEKDKAQVDQKAHLDKAKDQLKVLDDLSLVLNTLFTKYGHTLPQSFMFFLFGGKIHLMVEMDKDLRLLMEEIGKVSAERKVDVNLLLGMMLKELVPQYRPAWAKSNDTPEMEDADVTGGDAANATDTANEAVDGQEAGETA